MGGTAATNNLAAVIVLMNPAVNAHLHIESNAPRMRRLEGAMAVHDDIADQVKAELRERLDDAGA